MRAHLERQRKDSYINRALAEEMTFVLLGRDPVAAETIRAWVDARVRIGKNKPHDPQIVEAMLVAQKIDEEFEYMRRQLKEFNDNARASSR